MTRFIKGENIGKKDTDGLYIFTVSYVLRSVFLSIARSYIKAALSFSGHFAARRLKEIILGYNFKMV
jgi:hypothetical protein